MNQSRDGRPSRGFRPIAATVLLLLVGAVSGFAPLVGLGITLVGDTAAGLGTVDPALTGPGAPADVGGLSAQAVDLAGMTLSGPGGLPTITARTLAWGAAIATLATLLGWMPGRWLGRRRPGGRGAVVGRIVVLLPVCVPAYIVFYAWWQAWPAGSGLYQWAVDTERVPMVRAATLGVALVAWAWPIVALCVAPAAATGSADRDAAMRLDGRGRVRRGLVALRDEWPGLLTGWTIVCVLTIGNTTSFDLAQIATLGNELRAMAAIARPGTELLAASAPAIALAVPGAIVAWCFVRPAPPEGPAPASPPRAGLVVAAVLAAVGVLVPLGLLIVGVIGRADGRMFADLYGPGLLRSAGLAAATGLCTAGLVFVAGAALSGARPAHRRLIGGLAIAWAVAALIPATTFVTGMEATWNRGPLRTLVYTQPVIVLLAGLGRTGILALLLARGAVGARSLGARSLAGLDGDVGARGWFAAHRARLVPAAVSGGLIATVLGLSDASVAPRLAPPGFQPFAGMLLGGMHYQRGDIVLMGLFAIVGLAIIAASIMGITLALTRGHAARVAAAASRMAPAILLVGGVAMAVMANGCAPGDDSADGPVGDSVGASDESDAADPSISLVDADRDSPGVLLDDSIRLETLRTVGQAGIRAGEFEYPRALTADPVTDRVYVVDKTARIQAFTREGRLLGGWRMPEWENGKPTGLSVAPDGRVFVADTHYHRIVVFSTDGEEVMRFGEYGLGPGQFIFPTDVAFAPDGRLYVSEYGGNDRIQIFDADGTYLRSFGAFGDASGRFNRPQAMVFNADGTRLYIADACNHRIVVTDPEGEVIEIFGEAGMDPGQVHYPYDLNWLDDDTLMVSEFGNHRIQLFAADGTAGVRYGGFGAEPGRLKYPWGSVKLGDRVFVLDSGNARLQIVSRADIG